MSKFRRVAETQELPEFIQNTFEPQRIKTNDPYAHLRESAEQRRLRIASETLGVKTADTRVKNNDWERVTQASVYSNPRFTPADERMSNLEAADVSGRAIRRAGYDTDEDYTARSTFRWGSKDEYISALLQGPSMFTDLEEVTDQLNQASETRNQLFDSKEQRMKKMAARHGEWERQHLKTLKPRKIVASRANEIIRTSEENLVDGRFGLPDMDAIEERERQRLEMIDRKREERLAISRNGHDPDDNWEKNLNPYAPTYQSARTDWLERFIGEE